MEFEEGKIYKCGNERVKIIHFEPDSNNGGHGCIHNRTMVGVTTQTAGLFNEGETIYVSSISGVFDRRDGENSSGNPEKLQHYLKEIKAEPATKLKIEVGKTYDCGGTEVLILHHESNDTSSDTHRIRNGSCNGTFIGVPVDSNGKFDTDGLVGFFDDDDGENGCENPEKLSHDLKELKS